MVFHTIEGGTGLDFIHTCSVHLLEQNPTISYSVVLGGMIIVGMTLCPMGSSPASCVALISV